MSANSLPSVAQGISWQQRVLVGEDKLHQAQQPRAFRGFDAMLSKKTIIMDAIL